MAVHIPGKDAGASMNARGDRYAEIVWQRHFPDDAAPPIWVERSYLPGDKINQVWTDFTVSGRFRLEPPHWLRLSDELLQVLVGTDVVLARR